MGNLGLAWEEARRFGDDEMSIKGEKSDDDWKQWIKVKLFRNLFKQNSFSQIPVFYFFVKEMAADVNTFWSCVMIAEHNSGKWKTVKL